MPRAPAPMTAPTERHAKPAPLPWAATSHAEAPGAPARKAAGESASPLAEGALAGIGPALSIAGAASDARAAVVVAHGRAHRAGQAHPVQHSLPEEVPVAVVVNGTTLAVMMATPADIVDFAHGLILTEGVTADLAAIDSVETIAHPQGLEARFWLAEDPAAALAQRRRQMAGPVGCGLCGIDSLAQALRSLPRVAECGLRLTADDVAGAAAQVRARQSLHDLTRATHAAGFLVPGRGIVALREDVGRHNALDKLIGHLWQARTDLSRGAVVMTSRLSVELVQKCAVAGVPALIAASAPTGQALRAAEAAGITLIAWARDDGFDVLAHPHRLQPEVPNVR